MPILSNVELALSLKIPPRDCAQLDWLAAASHPCGRTTQVWYALNDTKVRTNCCGVPTRRVKELHAPSIPSQFSSGEMDMGAGTVVEFACRVSNAAPNACETASARTALGSSSIWWANDSIL